uniref:Glycosyl hydrolase family 13 catalytic domain-containing protein n=1 Tax=Megaselia scalaris TaxID=36166 RepID=T1H3Z5_MEGSC
FLAKQPDFNFRNQKVRDNFKTILKFWLDKGVYGFRVDAVPHIFEKLNEDGSWPDEPRNDWNNDPESYDYLDHIYTKDQPQTIDVIYEWREFMDSYTKENGGESRVILAEAYSPIETLNQYAGNATHKGAQIPFNFNLMGLNGYSNAREIDDRVSEWMNVIWKEHKVANWVNH